MAHFNIGLFLWSILPAIIISGIFAAVVLWYIYKKHMVINYVVFHTTAAAIFIVVFLISYWIASGEYLIFIYGIE